MWGGLGHTAPAFKWREIPWGEFSEEEEKCKHHSDSSALHAGTQMMFSIPKTSPASVLIWELTEPY